MFEAFREQTVEVISVLRDLSECAELLGACTIRDRIVRDGITKLEHNRFHLVVVGEFNHGKSSFINALVGARVLATGVTPTTCAITHLTHAQTPCAAVVLTSGTRESVAFDEAALVASGKTERAEPIDHLEIGYPSDLLREGVLLVDTPGVNDLSKQRADITYSYIPRADAVLFLLDAGQILKQSERHFLEEKVLKASRDKIIFVITKWDILSADEQAEALAYAKSQLRRWVDGTEPTLFAVSAEAALSPGRYDASGFPELVAHLASFLQRERGRIMLDHAIGDGVRTQQLLEQGANVRRRALTMNEDEIERRINALEIELASRSGTLEQRRLTLREQITAIRVCSEKNLEQFVNDTIRQVPGIIDAAKREDLESFFSSFVQDAFQRWAEAESAEIASKLESVAEATIALLNDDASATSKRLVRSLGLESGTFTVSVNTLRYDAGVAAVLLVGIGAAMAGSLMLGAAIALVGAPALAMIVRDRIDAEYKNKMKERAPDLLRAAGAQIAPSLAKAIEEFGSKLDAWMVSASEELHREILDVLHADRQSRRARRDRDRDAHTVDNHLANDEASLAIVSDIETRLARAKHALEALKASLAQTRIGDVR